MIDKLKVKMNYNTGIFDNKNLKVLATAINQLINKSNEQTEVINHLLHENEELRKIKTEKH